MSKSVIDKIDYTVYCVNEFARSNSLSYRDAFDYLDKYHAIDFITDFYVENSMLYVFAAHSESSAVVNSVGDGWNQWFIDKINNRLSKNGSYAAGLASGA